MNKEQKKAQKKQDALNKKAAKEAQTNKAQYKVVLLEKLGGTVREIKDFYADRWIDTEDHVVYLKNDKLKFMEIFPQQINDSRNYSPEEVNILLKKVQEQLKDESLKDTDEINDKSLETQLMKLKAKKRSFKFDANSSYLAFDVHGRPTFYFLREGSTFFPFKWDTDTKTIFVPSDNRKKSASIALRNKENKYNTKKIIEGATILLLVIGFIFFGAGGYFWFKANQASQQAFNNYDASEIAKAQRGALTVANQCAEITKQVAQAGLGIYNTMEDQLNQNQTVIEGLRPE